MKIGNLEIGLNHKPLVIAEMSGNHNQSIDQALAIVDAAYFRKVDTPGMIGDSSYLKKKSGWKGSRDGKETIKKMVKKDIERMKLK